MPAATLDLVKSGTTNRALEQGATYRLTVTWKTGTPATAVDITGYTARMMMKATPDNDASEILSITAANPGVVTTKAPHKLKTGQTVVLPGVGGMSELTSRYTVTVVTPESFSIGVDTSAYTTYTSGGTVAFLSITSTSGTDGHLVLGTTGGDVQIYIKDTATEQMSGGGTYDLEMIASGAGADVTRLIQGSFAVTPSTTR